MGAMPSGGLLVWPRTLRGTACMVPTLDEETLMGTDAASMDAFFRAYAASLEESFTTGSTQAATEFYAFQALTIRDEVSWAYDDAAPLARDLDTLRQQVQAVGITDIEIHVTTVEPLTDVLTSVDVDWDLTDAAGADILKQGWRYVVQTTPDGPRIRSVAIRTRPET